MINLKNYYSGKAGKANLLWNNKHPLFKHRQVSSNVWQIVEKYFDSWNLANFYFFKGRHEDILVDSGIGFKFQKNGKDTDISMPLAFLIHFTILDTYSISLQNMYINLFQENWKSIISFFFLFEISTFTK